MVHTLLLVLKLEDVSQEVELGLNGSKVCENALKRAIKQMKKVYGKNNCEWCGRRGFEPGITAVGDVPRKIPIFIFRP